LTADNFVFPYSNANDMRFLTINSDDTGRAWLDRNLGAIQACETAFESSAVVIW
jgi:hypothetical protein